MRKASGILGLLVLLVAGMGVVDPEHFLSQRNLENLIRWTALFGILSIGVAFVIITGGIDLSVGSVVGLVGSLLPWLLVHRGWPVGAALLFAAALSLALGAAHGLLVTQVRLQPFVVTLCGLLIYRGLARWITGDQTQGFGQSYDGLRALATGKPCTAAALVCVAGGGAVLWSALRRLTRKGGRGGGWLPLGVGAAAAAGGGAAWLTDLGIASRVRVPTPFLILLGLAVLASLFLNRTVWGRHLRALGRSEQAARYSGIATGPLTVTAYAFCSLCAGLGGLLFAADVNSVPPSMHGNFYELYAIAAAVLGGCSLRGGEGSIAGVVAGAAVMRVLYNSINLLRIPTQLEFAIVGLVLLAGVASDEVFKRAVERRRRAV